MEFVRDAQLDSSTQMTSTSALNPSHVTEVPINSWPSMVSATNAQFTPPLMRLDTIASCLTARWMRSSPDVELAESVQHTPDQLMMDSIAELTTAWPMKSFRWTEPVEVWDAHTVTTESTLLMTTVTHAQDSTDQTTLPMSASMISACPTKE